MSLEEHLSFTSYLYATDLKKHTTPYHFRVGGKKYVEVMEKLRKILFTCKVIFNIAVIMLTIGGVKSSHIHSKAHCSIHINYHY